LTDQSESKKELNDGFIVNIHGIKDRATEMYWFFLVSRPENYGTEIEWQRGPIAYRVLVKERGENATWLIKE